MIRGPILPQARAHLWSLVKSRLDAIETALELVQESLDCSEGQCGVLEGLCRDAGGAPVLLALAVPDDAMLLPRILAAADFLDRVGGSLGEAVPEGHFLPGARPRLLVIGTEASGGALHALARLHLERLELCRLEPFRLADTERFAVRRLGACGSLGTEPAVRGDHGSAPGRRPSAPAGNAVVAAAAVAPSVWDDPLWCAVERLCDRLDPAVRVEQGRFRRRITWRGRPLGHVTALDGILHGSTADGYESRLESHADVHTFGARLMRCLARLAGLIFAETGRDGSDRPVRAEPATATEPTGGRTFAERAAAHLPSWEGRLPENRASGPRSDESRSLRSAMAAAQLSPEEFAALAEPTDSERPNAPPD